VSDDGIRSKCVKVQGSSWTTSGASSSCLSPEGSISAVQWLSCISLISFSVSSSVGSFLYIGSPCSSDFSSTPTGLTLLCFRRFLNLRKSYPAPRSASIATATPTPIPALASLDSGVAGLLCIAARIFRGADAGVKAAKSVAAHATFTGVARPVNGKAVMVNVRESGRRPVVLLVIVV